MPFSEEELACIQEEQHQIYHRVFLRALTQIRFFVKCAEYELENTNEVVHYSLSKIAKGWIRLRGTQLVHAKMNIQLPGKTAIQTKLKQKYQFKHLRKILNLIKELLNEEELGYRMQPFDFEDQIEATSLAAEESSTTTATGSLSSISSPFPPSTPSRNPSRPSPLTSSTNGETPIPVVGPTKMINDSQFVINGQGFEMVPITDFPFDKSMLLDDFNNFILHLQKVHDYMTKSIENERLHFHPSLGRGVKFKVGIIDARIMIHLTRGMKERYEAPCEFKTLHCISNLMDEAATVAFRLQRKIQAFDQLNV